MSGGEIISVAAGLIDLLHKGGSSITVPKPFQQEIFLIKTDVAGTTHVDNIAELAEGVAEGDTLVLLREPDNPADDLAILVKTVRGDKLGYVPRRVNAVFARLMDAGKELFAKVRGKSVEHEWHRITIEIYLRD